MVTLDQAAARRASRALAWVGLGLVAAALGLLVVVLARQTPARELSQVLLTCLGLGVGSLLAALHLGALRRWPRLALVGLAAILVSQVAFHLLVWSGWKTHSAPWRVWWIAMVAALLASHLALLRLARRDGRDRLVDVAAWSALPAALGFAALALRRDLLAELPLALEIPGALVVALTTLTSLAVAGRAAAPAVRSRSVPRRVKLGAIAAGHVAALLVGIYLGRTGTEVSQPAPASPSALAHLSVAEVEAQTVADLERLRTVVAGLDATEQRLAELQARLRRSRSESGRAYLRPEEDDELRWAFVTYLSYRTALLRLVTTYSGFEAVRDPGLAGRCFLLGYAAAVTVYRSGLDLVDRFGAEELERSKLNEAEPAWGLPAGMLDRVAETVTAERPAALCEEMAAYLEHHRQRWRELEAWPEGDLAWLEGEISRNLAALRGRGEERHRRLFDLFLTRVRSDAYSPVYAVQSMVATWIGDVRILDRPPLVTPEALAAVEPLLEPGDILLERRSWYASNAFLPGFWPHAALYVGTLDDLRRLGVADAPEVAARLDRYATPAVDGHPNTVIEAVSEGVVFNSLEHSLAADYAAAVRPRLSREQIGQAVVEAFRHQGKPYDFEFDFQTADRLVCTELVYRSYRDLLHLDLVRVMGRDTLPAIEIVRTFARQRGTGSQQLDLVFFLDGDPAAGTAVRADEAAFIASADRPREFNE